MRISMDLVHEMMKVCGMMKEVTTRAQEYDTTEMRGLDGMMRRLETRDLEEMTSLPNRMVQ
jgi:hypothetical protein